MSREDEQTVADALGKAWGCTLVRMPRYAMFDFIALRRGQCIALVEIKCRTHAPNAYPTLMLSLQKWSTLRVTSDVLCVPSVLAVRFDDGSIHAADLAKLPVVKVEIGGRTDLGLNDGDVEPCVFLPVNAMRQAVAS